MEFTLRQLRYAIAVSQTGHFGKAADLCAVSQPALSQQIQLLEAGCGSAIFERLKGGATLTPFGSDFISRAREVLDSASALESFVVSHRGAPSRPIRFGLIPTVAPYLLPEVFPKLREELPDLQFSISESRTESLLAGIAEGSLDIALIATEPPPQGPRLTVAPLFEDPFVLATPFDEDASHPASLAQIAPERILLLDEGHCFRDQTIAACRLDGERGTRTFAATSLSTIVEFVANGQGVTLLPSIALRKEANNPRIAIHPLEDTSASRELRLVWRQSAPYGNTFHQIAAVLQKANPKSSQCSTKSI